MMFRNSTFLCYFLKSFYFFLAVRGLRCCVGSSLVVMSGGYSCLWCAGSPLQCLLSFLGRGSRVHGLPWLQHMGSGVAVPRLWSTGSVAMVHGLSCFLACGIFRDEESNPMSPSLAGGFFITEPPGKPPLLFYKEILVVWHCCQSL